MKSRLLKTGIGTIIFLLLVAAVFVVIQPVYKGVSTVLHSNEQKLLDELADKTGLGLSYKSLSPSILTGIHIKGIDVYEIDTKKTLLTVQKAVLHYRLSTLIKGDIANAFSGLSITGVNFSFDNTGDSIVVEKLNTLISTTPEQPEQTSLFQPETIETIKKTLFTIPFSIKVKKVSVDYRDKNTYVTAALKSLQLKKQKDGSSISADMSGNVSVEVSKTTHETAGVSFALDGRLLRDTAGSSAICSLSEYSKADYTLGKVECLVRYNNMRVVFRSLMDVKPLNVYGSFDMNTGDVEVNMQLASFNPFSLVKFKKPIPQLKQFEGTYVTGNAQLSYGVVSSLFSWKAVGSLNLPQESYFTGERISFNVNGNNEKINIKSLTADGNLATIDFSGSYSIPTMQPSGTLSVVKYVLPNGNTIAGDLYFDPLAKGFLCFIPQLFLGEQTLTALQLTVVPQNNSIDFSFDMNDYSHADFDTPGDIKIDGSYTLGDHQYVQASASISNFFLDTASQIVSFFLDKASAQTVDGFRSTLEPYIFTNELYISSDLKSVSFNSPYSVIANTKQDKQFLLLSFDGNESSVQVSEFNLIYGNQSVVASLEADISQEDKQVLFSSDCMINSIPYHFNGDFRDGKWLGITGDYGLDAAITFGDKTEGTAQLISLPISVNGYILSLSTSVAFNAETNGKFNVDIKNFEFEEVSGKVKSQPKFALSGSVSETGFVISSLLFADNISSLDGSGEFLWNINDGMFESLNAYLAVSNDLNNERVSLTGYCTNPMRLPLTVENLTKNYFFTAETGIESFSVSHFMSGQLADDTLSAKVTASGTVENPYVSIELGGSSLQWNGAPLVVKGNAVLEDGAANISDLEMEWSGMKISHTKADFNLKSFIGTAGADFNLSFGGKTMYAPFNVTMYPLSDKKVGGAPESFVISFDTDSITGTLLNQNVPVHVKATRKPGRMDITSDKNLGLSGWVLDDGTMSLAVSDDKPIHVAVDGKVNGQIIDFNFKGIYCDLSRLSSLINTNYFSVYHGILSGKLSISGLGTDPDMDGSFTLDDFECNLPDYIPEHIIVKRLVCTCSQDEFSIPKTPLLVKDSILDVMAKLSLDRWNFDSVSGSLISEGTKGVPVDIKVPLIRMQGDVGLNTNFSFSENTFDVGGTVTLQNSELTAMSFSGPSSESSSSSSSAFSSSAPAQNINMRISLKLLVDQKVKIVLNPLLRGLVAPQTPIEFTMDTEEGTWNVKGDVVLRGGEVSYLNRNFYLKEGRIVLNETQNSFDPNLTIRAETRERDENGEPVTISLSAIRQNASHFSPLLTATPAKSENEIYSLLGQIVTADSSKEGQFSVSNLLIAGLDYGVQVTLLRKGEDALRDLCNFDIVSMRTMMLQNALKQGLNLNQGTANTYSFGNYFDNSTVYIGKYLGSALYADALLQWTYDSSRYTKDNPVSGIVFQPELGLELSSPFANIRWNFEPNLGTFEGAWYDPLVESLVPATSITLSWKFSF